MQQHVRPFPIKRMCRVFDGSRSGFYAWRQRQAQPRARAQRRAVLDQRVETAFLRHTRRYGAPRIAQVLAQQGHACNRKTVAASLQRQQLRAKAARRFTATTNSKHRLPVAANLLAQDFSTQAPKRKWVGDITSLGTEEGWLYLAVVIDLYARRVVGWSMSERMSADLACDALTLALNQRGNPGRVIVHSDRGVQDCSQPSQRIVRKQGLRCCMSAKGNGYDNACAESFFHSLKVEAIHGEHVETREAMRRAVFEYIEADDNRNRLHRANGYLSPADFEARYAS